MTEGIRACSVTDLAAGEAMVIPEEKTGTGDGIAVFNDEGEFYALDDTCSHEEASLAEGWIEDGEVECPLHSSRFSLSTGEVLCLPATRGVRAYRVDVVNGDVLVFPGEEPAG
jgi:3-phenylpropionate/trans-cinnamate dioxygenase ferredoxin subunit